MARTMAFLPETKASRHEKTLAQLCMVKVLAMLMLLLTLNTSLNQAGESVDPVVESSLRIVQFFSFGECP
jgi:hypothetical protein